MPKHKTLTLAAFLAPFALSEDIIVLDSETLTADDQCAACDLLFSGKVEDLDPYYFEGKNPTWMRIRGMHVEFVTYIGGFLHIYVR